VVDEEREVGLEGRLEENLSHFGVALASMLIIALHNLNSMLTTPNLYFWVSYFLHSIFKLFQICNFCLV